MEKDTARILVPAFPCRSKPETFGTAFQQIPGGVGLVTGSIDTDWDEDFVASILPGETVLVECVIDIGRRTWQGLILTIGRPRSPSVRSKAR